MGRKSIEKLPPPPGHDMHIYLPTFGFHQYHKLTKDSFALLKVLLLIATPLTYNIMVKTNNYEKFHQLNIIFLYHFEFLPWDCQRSGQM